MAELATRHTCAEAVVADTDGSVLERICKVIFALGHRADEDTDAFSCSKVLHVVSHPNDFGVEAESDLATIGRKMIGDGILDHFEKLLLRVGGSDGEFVQQLDHEPCKAFERARNSHGRADLDEHTFGGVDVNL